MVFIVEYKNQENEELKKGIQFYSIERLTKLKIGKYKFKQIYISEYINFEEKKDQLEIEMEHIDYFICLTAEKISGQVKEIIQKGRKEINYQLKSEIPFSLTNEENKKKRELYFSLFENPLLLEQDLANIFIKSGHTLIKDSIITISAYINHNMEIEEDQIRKYFNDNEKEVIFMIKIKEIMELSRANADSVFFGFNKQEKNVTEISNPRYIPDNKRKTKNIEMITKDPNFLTLLAGQFSGEGAIPEQVKLFYKNKDAILSSILIFYYQHKRILFLLNTPEDIYILSSDFDTFMDWNSKFLLIESDYEETPKPVISIKKSMVNYRYDISFNNETIKKEAQTLRDQILNTFPEATSRIQLILNQLTDKKLNEYSFYYDKMCVKIKITNIAYTIDFFKSK